LDLSVGLIPQLQSLVERVLTPLSPLPSLLLPQPASASASAPSSLSSTFSMSAGATPVSVTALVGR
jgi:hypothetical protein